MSKIAKLLGKPKIYKIGEVELELHPRKVKDLDILMDIAEPSKQAEAMKKLIYVTLKEADPEATDEELDNVSTEYFEEISKAIMDVNGLEAPKNAVST